MVLNRKWLTDENVKQQYAEAEEGNMDTVQAKELEAEKKSVVEHIDFKMVTFSLAGKEYGIDIMKVKEISKADRFTYVPNTAPYVRGVYNLRGDIISIIDLRKMFNLPVPEAGKDNMEDMIILRLDNYFIGVIVDTIDKVVGIASSSIQAPHPLFGDINIKFIKGIVENENKLYIILDVEKILGNDQETESSRLDLEVMGIPMTNDQSPAEDETESRQSSEDLGIEFLQDTLKTFKRFTVSDINREWVISRFAEWRNQHGGSDEESQLKSPEEGDEFLAPFYSRDTGNLWTQDYADAIRGLLPSGQKGNLSIWNAGCAKGYETYSILSLLKGNNPEAVLKVWAHDNDLLSISTAPSLLFQEMEIPEHFKSYVQETKGGFQFKDDIRNHILFEYHDILHNNPFPQVDVIIARDVLSFLAKNEQETLINEFDEKLKNGGLLIIGTNERMNGPEWEPVESAGIVAYRKKS